MGKEKRRNDRGNYNKNEKKVVIDVNSIRNGCYIIVPIIISFYVKRIRLFRFSFPPGKI